MSCNDVILREDWDFCWGFQIANVEDSLFGKFPVRQGLQSETCHETSGFGIKQWGIGTKHNHIGSCTLPPLRVQMLPNAQVQ